MESPPPSNLRTPNKGSLITSRTQRAVATWLFLLQKNRLGMQWLIMSEMTNSRRICHGQQRTRCWRGWQFCRVARRAVALTTRRCHTQCEVPDTYGAGKAREEYAQWQLVRGTDRRLRTGPRKNREENSLHTCTTTGEVWACTSWWLPSPL